MSIPASAGSTSRSALHSFRFVPPTPSTANARWTGAFAGGVGGSKRKMSVRARGKQPQAAKHVMGLEEFVRPFSHAPLVRGAPSTNTNPLF
ncbi:hypothetical protein BT69DRAFT_942071 [Atractiella rhizophila]|nr:hypothetical protein BT69DRAFT_942071 [Atractiella rhizophila]